ncbi:hypothetical protein BLOT_013387 [Blomia tropicalis]|nr:hypothetical protein BLOT_013387 [Blomia tropicalis]
MPRASERRSEDTTGRPEDITASETEDITASQRSLALDGSRPARFCLQHLKKEDLKTRRYNLKRMRAKQRSLAEILRKQSLAFFIFPTTAAIGSSKQSSPINRRWAISYYFLQYIHNTLLSNPHYNTLLPNTH